MARFRIETRPTDFVARTGGLYSAGCCCCCCCLHWIGAAVGLGVGARSAFVAMQRAGRYTHRAMRTAVILGLLSGIVLSGILVALLQGWIVLALAPSVLILPAIGMMLLLVKREGLKLNGAYRRRRLVLAADAAAPPALPQGVFRTASMTKPERATAIELAGHTSFCPVCWHTLDDEVVTECPSCQAPIDVPNFPAVQEGMQLALSTGGRAFLWSTGLSIAAYGLMYLVLIVFK